MKGELTLQSAQSAYYVPGIVLATLGTSNKENNNVYSFKTQFPLKLFRVSFTRAHVWPLTLRPAWGGDLLLVLAL